MDAKLLLEECLCSGASCVVVGVEQWRYVTLDLRPRWC